MIDEPSAPRPQRGQALALAAREDLDLYGVEELKERIEALEGEIARSRAQIEKKQAGRSAADALFNFKTD